MDTTSYSMLHFVVLMHIEAAVAKLTRISNFSKKGKTKFILVVVFTREATENVCLYSSLRLREKNLRQFFFWD